MLVEQRYLSAPHPPSVSEDFTLEAKVQIDILTNSDHGQYCSGLLGIVTEALSMN
jgi:hypothetical protein